MKLWRVHWRIEHGNSAGFSWFTRKRDAKAEIDRVVERDGLQDHDQPELEGFEFDCTAQGLLEALKRFAEHADNG